MVNTPNSYGSDNSLKIYLNQIGKIDLLTRKQEVELAEKIEAGDEAARQDMIKANLRLVVKIAGDYKNYGLSLSDLIEEGNIGLMKAVDRFDPEQGKFSTYAAWWIKQSVRRALSNQSKTIRLPVHMVDKITRVKRISGMLSEKLGRDPTDAELGEELGVSAEKIGIIREASQKPLSLDQPIMDDGEGSTLQEIIADENSSTPIDALIKADSNKMATSVLDVLNEREQKIIHLRFGLDGEDKKTLEEIGILFGVTRERIRQLQNNALRKIRQVVAQNESLDEDDCVSTKDAVWGGDTMKHKAVRTREGAIDFADTPIITVDHLKKLPNRAQIVLMVWYSPQAWGKDPEHLIAWINEKTKQPLDEKKIQDIREKGIKDLGAFYYGKKVKDHHLLQQNKIMDGLRKLLLEAFNARARKESQ